MIVPLAFLIGICFGSFGNVLIYRMPAKKTVRGRSMCRKCSNILHWFELIPVVSYVLQLGRCRSCDVRLSLQYPLIELASGCLFALAVYQTVSPILGFLTGLCLWVLLIIAMIDAKTSLIPDALNVPLFILAVTVSMFRDGVFLLPMVIGGGMFLLQWVVSGGRAIGSGDIILGAAVGALLGSIPLVLFWLVFSYIFGSLVALVLLALRKTTLKSAMPFAPVLCTCAIIMQLYGMEILRYFSLL
jgi:prepilin signal peptidase PulO-like enzyme (type II secretory pathway)